LLLLPDGREDRGGGRGEVGALDDLVGARAEGGDLLGRGKARDREEA